MLVPLVVVVEFTFAITAYALVARWYIVPLLLKHPLRVSLPPLLLVHLVRPISLWLLVPGVIVDSGIPTSFATGTAYGDLLATVLALVAAVLVRKERRGAIAAAWIFNIVGVTDALRNCVSGMMTQAPAHMGAAVLVPAYGVPLLLVSHALMFYLLVLHRRGAARSGG
jgi:hypothetical protein